MITLSKQKVISHSKILSMFRHWPISPLLLLPFSDLTVLRLLSQPTRACSISSQPDFSISAPLITWLAIAMLSSFSRPCLIALSTTLATISKQGVIALFSYCVKGAVSQFTMFSMCKTVSTIFSFLINWKLMAVFYLLLRTISLLASMAFWLCFSTIYTFYNWKIPSFVSLSISTFFACDINASII